MNMRAFIFFTLSLVCFSGSAQAMYKAIDGIRCLGSDELCGGWCFPIRAGLGGRIISAPNGKPPVGVPQQCLNSGQTGASHSTQKQK